MFVVFGCFVCYGVCVLCWWLGSEFVSHHVCGLLVWGCLGAWLCDAASLTDGIHCCYDVLCMCGVVVVTDLIALC